MPSTDEKGGTRLRAVLFLLALAAGSMGLATAASRSLPTPAPAAGNPAPQAEAARPQAPVPSAGKSGPTAVALQPAQPGSLVSAAAHRAGGAARLIDLAWAAYARTEDELVADPAGREGNVGGADGSAGYLLQPLTKVGVSLAAMESALAGRDPRFFAAMGEGSRALVELQTVWRRGGPRGPAWPAAGPGFDALSGFFRTLRSAYGQEEVRHRGGRPLGAAEARHLARLQAAQRQLAARLQALAARARERLDQRLVVELARLDAELARLAAAPPTLDGYLNALIRTDVVLGEWAASASLLQPEEQPEWLASDAAAQELSTDADTGFVMMADLGSGATWTYLEAEGAAAQSPDSAAGPRQYGFSMNPGDPGLSADSRTFGDSLDSGGSEVFTGSDGVPSPDGAGMAGEETATDGASGAMELEPFNEYRETGVAPAGEESRGAASAMPGAVERLADGTIVFHGGSPAGLAAPAADLWADDGAPAVSGPGTLAAETFATPEQGPDAAESNDDLARDLLSSPEMMESAPWIDLPPGGRAPFCPAALPAPNSCPREP